MVAVALSVAACSPRIDSRGNLPDPDKLAEIKPGEHSRNDVAEILGSPSSIGVFDQETWYYISKRTEAVAFFEPEVAERQVIIVRFNKKGVVTGVETLGLEQGHGVDPVDRETPTAGAELTIMQQLLGNMGRFNKPKQ
jgi:outer membrane protein assembly factor BamE (lipoprotein component of BamABCDE complex)